MARELGFALIEPSREQQRVAFVLPNMRGGGAERVALYLVSRFVEAEIPVDLVLGEAKGELLHLVPAEVRIIDLKASRFRSMILPLARYFRDERPYSAQVRMWPLTAVAIIAKLLARSDTCLIVSDHANLTSQYGESAGTMLALKWTTKLLYPLADVRIAISRGVAENLAKLSGLPVESFEVVHNPVAPIDSDLQPNGDEAWGGGKDARIVTVGTLKAQKNQKLLIRAFARLRKERPAKLMIVGDGELRSELLEEAERQKVAGDLIMPGFVTHPAALVASGDLFVLSSDYEGFGNVLVEAMRLGVPVVSTDCPNGPAEILGDGEFGLLVPCGDEQALAEAMAKALDSHPSPDVLKARAEQISGAGAVARYVALMTGGPSAPAFANVRTKT